MFIDQAILGASFTPESGLPIAIPTDMAEFVEKRPHHSLGTVFLWFPGGVFDGNAAGLEPGMTGRVEIRTSRKHKGKDVATTFIANQTVLVAMECGNLFKNGHAEFSALSGHWCSRIAIKDLIAMDTEPTGNPASGPSTA